IQCNFIVDFKQNNSKVDNNLELSGDGGLSEVGGDSVEILANLLGENAALAILALVDPLEGLKRLQGLADDASGSLGVGVGLNSTAELASVDVAESVDSDGRADVQAAGERSGANVVPVGVDGSHVLGDAKLDEVGPLGDLYLQILLEEVGDALDDLILVDVLDGGRPD
ncbi:hypothetical protein PMAYCL1PPCAC_25133, partial [Pristionchus mayeri]